MNKPNDEYNKRLQAEADGRREMVERLRAAGKRWREIADLLGVTTARAQQIGTVRAKRKKVDQEAG